jgi:hypothetical protein
MMHIKLLDEQEHTNPKARRLKETIKRREENNKM